MEDVEIGVCLEFKGFFFSQDIACLLALEKQKIFSTAKNIHKGWSESKFCCSDHFV